MDNNKFGYFGKRQKSYKTGNKSVISHTSPLEVKRRMREERDARIKEQQKKKTSTRKWTKDEMMTLIFRLFEEDQDIHIFRKDVTRHCYGQSDKLVLEVLREICWNDRAKWYLKEDYKIRSAKRNKTK